MAAIESATGIRTDTVTGANGRYSFPSIRPTTYEIRAEMTGFKTVRRTDITLQANQNLTVNITLELGDLSETITVAGETATVDISSATIARGRRPRAHRRAADRRPRGGAAADAGGWHGAGIDQRGNRQVDPGRGPHFGQRRRRAPELVPARRREQHRPVLPGKPELPVPRRAAGVLDSDVSNYSAAHGNSAGAVVNVVTRSGTNSFHGGAFEYLRDRTFNSKGFFSAEKDFLKRNQYGGFAGGPIRRNSTFFFAGWQRTRITNRASELIRFVPTAAQRRGDFSNCVPACPQLYNPATGLPFPNNQIPADLWDPAAVKVFAALPTSNLANGRGHGSSRHRPGLQPVRR